MEPAGVGPEDGCRQFSSLLTGDWYQWVRTAVPPNTTPKAYSCFWDATVKATTGAKYSALQLYDNHLPLDVRFRSENITIFGFVPVVRPPVADLRYAMLSGRGQKDWLRADRRAVDQGVYRLIRDGFAACAAGVRIDPELWACRRASWCP